MTIGPGEPELARPESEPLSAGPLGDTEVAIQRRTQWQLVRARILRDKITVVVLAVCLLFALVAVSSPFLDALGLIDPLTPNQDLVSGVGSLPTGPLGGVSTNHLLGVEPGTGRDLLSRLLTGVTTSLLVASLATALSLTIGTVLGIVAGFSGGRTDWLISRLMDLILSFPQILMLLTLAPILIVAMHDTLHFPVGAPSQVAFMVIVLGFFGWPYFARLIRGQVLSLREREFIEAARSLGARRGRLYFRELLPHLWVPILVYGTLIMPLNVAAEATLGFLGVGIQAPAASLGSILNDSISYAAADPAYFIIPGATLAIIVLAFNMLGDGLGDALDPKSGRS